MDTDRSNRPEDQPDYDGWKDLDSSPEPEPSPIARPASHAALDPPKDKPAFDFWKGLGMVVETALEPLSGGGNRPPPQLAVVGAMLALPYLGVNAPTEANAAFAGWLTVVILVASLGGLALFRGTRNATTRASGADPPTDVGDDPAG